MQARNFQFFLTSNTRATFRAADTLPAEFLPKRLCQASDALYFMRLNRFALLEPHAGRSLPPNGRATWRDDILDSLIFNPTRSKLYSGGRSSAPSTGLIGPSNLVKRQADSPI